MKALHEFINRDSARLLGVDRSLKQLLPISEPGQFLARRLTAFVAGEEDALCEHQQRLQEALEMLQHWPETCDRIRHHLNDLPRIAPLWDMNWGQAEIALLLRFRRNHQALRDSLKDNDLLSGWLQLKAADALSDGLPVDVFEIRYYLKDDSNPSLSKVREQIRNIQVQIAEQEQEARKRLAKRHELPETNAAWVIDRSDTQRLERLKHDDELMLADESITTVTFKALEGPQLAELRGRLSDLLVDEHRIENEIYQSIQQQQQPNETAWREEEDKLARLDLLFAMANLASNWNAVQPEISSNGKSSIRIREARHVLVEEWVEQSDADYTPLTLNLNVSCAVLGGPNMGGKTVVLQTVGWLQTLTQLGMFVPAQGFTTHLFSRVEAIGPASQEIGGLSAFGREIDRLRQALPDRNKTILYLLDEPGRTTGVAEGRALVQAILDTVRQSPSALLMASHLDGLGGAEVTALAMAGLDHQALARWREQQGSAKPPLHQLMDYRVIPAQQGDTAKSDALDVAELLGLETEIIAQARDLLKHQGG